MFFIKTHLVYELDTEDVFTLFFSTLSSIHVIKTGAFPVFAVKSIVALDYVGSLFWMLERFMIVEVYWCIILYIVW
jgi:hypothetical protein